VKTKYYFENSEENLLNTSSWQAALWFLSESAAFCLEQNLSEGHTGPIFFKEIEV